MLRWFGIGEGVKTVEQALRGEDEPPALDVWILDRHTGKEKRLTSSGGFQSPVFGPAGDVFAIHDRRLAILHEGKSPPREIALALDGDDPERLLGTGADKNASQVAVLTRKGRVYAVDPASGTSELLADALSDEARSLLDERTRICGGNLVFSRQQKSEGLQTRWDLFLRRVDSQMSHPLTAKSPRTVHVQPSFSSACDRIAFIGSS